MEDNIIIPINPAQPLMILATSEHLTLNISTDNNFRSTMMSRKPKPCNCSCIKMNDGYLYCKDKNGKCTDKRCGHQVPPSLPEPIE